LLVVFGTNSFGGIGELAHIKMSEEVFNALAAQYPVTKRANLMRSEDIAVSEALRLLTAHWPPEPEEVATT
jgi:hypothetical protein